MRLDRYLSETGAASRSEAGKLIRAAKVSVDGKSVRDPSCHIDPASAKVTLDGAALVRRRFTYVMLNKPAGYVSSTEDRGPVVVELLPPQLRRLRLFPCGRLDIDTVGFLLLTNDGMLAHELLSPRHHVDKVYRFSCEPPICEETRRRLENGVDIGGCVTRPAEVRLYADAAGSAGEITLREGRFHQIKRMFAACGSGITSLERICFAGVPLDASLPRGEWRYLTEQEETLLRRAAGREENTADGQTEWS